ncbi:MAG: hypothetical protein ACJAYB_000041 [Psychromonas sp.]|jgi:hypothetical protein
MFDRTGIMAMVLWYLISLKVGYKILGLYVKNKEGK